MIANNSILPDLRNLKSGLSGIDLLKKLKIVSKSSSGIYCLLPLGTILISRLEDLIKRNYNESGCFEVRFPTLMSEMAWKKSLRWESFDSLLKIKDRSGKNLCLNPTHEEASVLAMQSIVQSYKDLPITFYCINKVYRDEIRYKNGLLRTKEFIMADSYSFAMDYDSSIKIYEVLIETHRSIFNQLGLKFIEATADNGDIGGSSSIEFIFSDQFGESNLVGCGECNYWTTKLGYFKNGYCLFCGNNKLILKKGTELAHIFQLDKVYTQIMDTRLLNSSNKFDYPYMNCSGIGVTRLLQVLVEFLFTTERKIAPKVICPFQVFIYNDKPKDDFFMRGNRLYNKLSLLGFRPLYDTRNISEKQKLILSEILNCSLNISIDSDSYTILCNNEYFKVQEHDIENYLFKLIKGD